MITMMCCVRVRVRVRARVRVRVRVRVRARFRVRTRVRVRARIRVRDTWTGGRSPSRLWPATAPWSDSGPPVGGSAGS